MEKTALTEQTEGYGKRTRFIIFIVIAVIVILSIVILVILYQMGYLTTGTKIQVLPPPPAPDIELPPIIEPPAPDIELPPETPIIEPPAPDVGPSPVILPPPILAPGEVAITSPTSQFRFEQGRDSVGGNIEQRLDLIDNIGELQAYCASIRDCRGFNTDGWLKHTIQPPMPRDDWADDPSKGLYIKR